MDDNYLRLEGTRCEGCTARRADWNLAGATVILPKNGTFEGIRIATNVMQLDGMDSIFLSVNVSESGSGAKCNLNGVNYFRYEQISYIEGIGMEATFHSFAGGSPTVIFEEVVPVLGASAHIFLPVDGQSDVGRLPQVILRAKSANTLKSTEVSPPRSILDGKSRVASLKVECNYNSTCEGLDINAIILNEKGRASFRCDGFQSCSNALVDIAAGDNSTLVFFGRGKSLWESKISLDISHSQRVEILVNCKERSCEGMIFDTSRVALASNGSFTADIPAANTLEVACLGIASCNNLTVSCPFRLEDVSPSSRCTLKVENSGPFSPLIEVYSYGKAEIECDSFSNCSQVSLHCGIGDPSTGCLHCGMEKLGGFWECVGDCSSFLAISSDFKHSYTLFPNELSPILSDVVFYVSVHHKCRGSDLCEKGVDCSSLFGREVQHCTIICDSCYNTVVNCPRYTKGRGTCTVKCYVSASCKGITILGTCAYGFPSFFFNL